MLLYESVSMKNSGRVIQSDKRFCSSAVRDEKLINVLFERLVAMKVQFNQVDFSYCIFDAAYLRNCSFIDCNFTGCRFLNSNLSGTSFHGCKFDYATFEKTYIDNDVLDTGCPGFENLKLKFARSLRLNYQQIGDAKSSNKAMAIELEATESHLFKAWNSKEAYYRHKYKDLKRFKVFMDWLCFKALDIIWGNGESALKLVRTVLWALLIIAAVHLLIFEDPLCHTSCLIF